LQLLQISHARNVLNKLTERLNEQAAYSVTQMPESRLGDNFAARIESQTVEQTTRLRPSPRN